MKRKLTIILTALFISLGFWQLLETPIYSQSKALTLGQVKNSLNVSNDKEKESAITAKKVRQVGVTFPLTREIEAELRRAGATNELIEAIRQNSPPLPTPIPTPILTPTPARTPTPVSTPISTPTPAPTPFPSPVPTLRPSATSERSFETLSAAVERGEEVVFKIKYYSITAWRTRLLSDGLVTVSKTTVTFQPTVDIRGFTVSPDKILELTYQSPLRVRMKVAIKKKGNKEDKKNFDFFNNSATVGRDVWTSAIVISVRTGNEIECTGCDDSMSVLYSLLQKVRGKI